MKSGFYQWPDCFSINPATRESTGWLQTFSVAVDGADFYPHPITQGPYKNCTKMPEGDAIDVSEEMGAAVRIGRNDPAGYEAWRHARNRRLPMVIEK